MYYTGVDPRTMKPIYVAHDPHEKAMQRALIQYRKPENYKLVREALESAGRRDLIGYGPKCLIRPMPPKPGESAHSSSNRSAKSQPAKSKKPQGSSRTANNSTAESHGKGSSKGKNAYGSNSKYGHNDNRFKQGHNSKQTNNGLSRAQNTAARNRAAQGRQGANRGHR